tara:strand:- start:5026 stop:5415 length:390 start_codon:yes stop_codon:yes gene_type:complete
MQDIQVVSKGIFYKNGKVLLLKITNDTAYDLPGGHLHFGESIEQGLYRECFEETGLKVKKAVKIGETNHKKPKHFFFVTKWLGEDIILQLEEVEKYKWTDIEKCSTYNLTRTAEDGIKLAEKYIASSNP